MSRRRVVVKPNFNSADPFPGSTHPATLESLVEWLGAAGASRVTVADRSGMGVTRDELPARDWIAHPLRGSHWGRGVLFPRLLQEADAVVSTCALKTHRFGGHFALSLKNSVGAVAKYGPDGYNYMSELHTSPDQRKMIAETDRVAVDAVGVAILRLYGTTRAVSTGKIFEQEQIARAVELGLGAAGPAEVELVTDDAAGEEFLSRLRPIFTAG